jgi:hypothetical protein
MSKQPNMPSVPGSRWFRVASWMLVMIAFGHTVGNHIAPPAMTPEKAQVVASMARVIDPVSGGQHRTVLDSFTGDSFCVGLAMLGFGLVNLLFERALRRRGEGVPVSVLAANIVVVLVNIGIALRFFPLAPLPFLVVALAGFAVALVRTRHGDALMPSPGASQVPRAP